MKGDRGHRQPDDEGAEDGLHSLAHSRFPFWRAEACRPATRNRFPASGVRLRVIWMATSTCGKGIELMKAHMRNIGGAVLGWVVMFTGVVILFSVLWMVLGAEGSFRPESWEISRMWALGSIVVGLLAALPGGFVCSKVAADSRGVWMLVALVVILGVADALTGAQVVEGTRPEGVSMTEAMMSGQQPQWIAWLNRCSGPWERSSGPGWRRAGGTSGGSIRAEGAMPAAGEECAPHGGRGASAKARARYRPPAEGRCSVLGTIAGSRPSRSSPKPATRPR